MTAQDPEQVQCYSDSDVCSSGTVPGPTLLTAEECCRGNGSSFSDATEGMCLVCIGKYSTVMHSFHIDVRSV